MSFPVLVLQGWEWFVYQLPGRDLLQPSELTSERTFPGQYLQSSADSEVKCKQGMHQVMYVWYTAASGVVQFDKKKPKKQANMNLHEHEHLSLPVCFSAEGQWCPTTAPASVSTAYNPTCRCLWSLRSHGSISNSGWLEAVSDQCIDRGRVALAFWVLRVFLFEHSSVLCSLDSLRWELKFVLSCWCAGSFNVVSAVFLFLPGSLPVVTALHFFLLTCRVFACFVLQWFPPVVGPTEGRYSARV